LTDTKVSLSALCFKLQFLLPNQIFFSSQKPEKGEFHDFFRL